MIGIIAALEQEAEDIKNEMMLSQSFDKAGMSFVSGKLYGVDMTVVVSGVGKVNAALCAQILIDCYGVDTLINVGVAGALADGMAVGDIVLSRDTVQHDMDATAAGCALGEIPEMGGVIAFNADTTLLEMAKQAATTLNVTPLVGRVLTADRVVATHDFKMALNRHFHGICVEMEGGAIGQVAYVNQIPYLVIRCISDQADESLTETYEANFAQSMANASLMVKAMVRQISERG